MSASNGSKKGGRKFGRVPVSFWSDKITSKLSEPAKTLALYLMTGKHSNTLGCLNTPVGYLASDLKTTIEDIEKRLQELESIGFLAVDYDEGLILITRLDCRESPKTTDQAKGLEHILLEFIDSSLAFSLSKCILNTESKLRFSPELIDKLNKINELGSCCSLTPSLTTGLSGLQGRVTREQENKRTREQENIKKINKKKSLEGFDEYWNRFPNSSKKSKAQEYWIKHKCSTFLDVMFADLDERERLNPWTPDDESGTTGWGWDKRYQYQPGIAPYLNQRRWEDSNKQFAKPTKNLTYAEKQKAEAAIARAKRDNELKAAEEERQLLIDSMTNEEREDYKREQEEYAALERELMENGGFK